MKTRRNDLIYSKECYLIMGLIFEVYNELGYGYKEAHYEEAIANKFRKNKIPFKRQLRAKLKCEGREIGIYIIDFLVFGKIVIELKQKNYFSKREIDQLYSYLKVTNLKLGLLVYFTKQGIRYKRIVNLK